MHFSNESEALLALVSVILSADEVGTIPERKYLFDHVGTQKPFSDLDPRAFSHMVSNVNEQLFGESTTDNILMRPSGIAEFSAAVKACLSPERINPAFHIACEIACADELIPVEQNLLFSIGSHLGISTQEITQILDQTEKFYPLTMKF